MKPADVRAALAFYTFLRPTQRQHFFATASRTQLGALEEACLNLLKNPSGLKKADLARIRKYREKIRVLSAKYETLKSKRKVLTQRGGFLSALLPLLLTLVTSFIPNK
jgi:hypothetical protein